MVFFSCLLRIPNIEVLEFCAIPTKCRYHIPYKSFIFRMCSIENAEYPEKNMKRKEKKIVHIHPDTRTISREPILNLWPWKEKHLRHYNIETKSFNKTEPTLLTCASSFSSSTYTIITVHNVGVNTSYVPTLWHKALFVLPLSVWLDPRTHYESVKFLPWNNFQTHSLGVFFFAYHALKCTKGTVLLSQIYSMPIHVRNSSGFLFGFRIISCINPIPKYQFTSSIL